MNDSEHISEEDLFSSLLALATPAERSACLERACGSDARRRERLEELLRAEGNLGAFMECHARRPRPAKEDAGIGRRIGRYRIREKIGEGGCGVVYAAEQEEPVRRRVALKIIKLGMDTRHVVARFEAERQALARMDHPNIARVFDGGATESGRPFFVMELVPGVKITEFCDLNRLNTRQRLELFIQVCRAVQHAHQKGIIHRDLKPSNILVAVDDGKPVPKIIDFGIAKATEGRLTEQTVYTEMRQFIGTPAYMSPEQAVLTSLDIDTRSDIYSLGVLLYELLTGRTPFDAQTLLRQGVEAIRKTISETDPPRPSTRLGTLAGADLERVAALHGSAPPKLLNAVRGDLDWVVMKALEKDRARRYDTANGLAQDLQRFLSSEPILAHPPSTVYRLRKWVRRHQLVFTAASGIAAALVAGLALATWALVRAQAARQQAERAGAEASFQRGLASHQAELARAQAYLAGMNLAHRALQEGDLGGARSLLQQAVPGAGEADLRRWEWRYLAHECGDDPHLSLAAHSGIVSNVRFLDDRTLVTTGFQDRQIIRWNLVTRRPSSLATNTGNEGLTASMLLLPERQLVVDRPGWVPNECLRLIDLATGRESAFPKRFPALRSVDLAPDHATLAVATSTHVELTDLAGERSRPPLREGSTGIFVALFSPDGRSLVIGEESGALELWDLAQRRKVADFPHPPAGTRLLRFAPDGRWLVQITSEPSTNVWVWSVPDRALVASWKEEPATERNAVFSPNARWLAIGGGSSAVRIWDAATWRLARTLHGHTQPAAALCFSPDSRLLASGDRNGAVRVWPLDDTPRGQDAVQFDASDWIEVARDGSAFLRIARLTTRGRGYLAQGAELWAASPLRSLGAVPMEDLAVSRVAVLPAGAGVVIGCLDESLRVRGPDSLKERVAPRAFSSFIGAMDISAEGSTLATIGAGHAQPVCVWRLPGFELLAEGCSGLRLIGVALSPAGTAVAGFAGTGNMGVWKVPSLQGPSVWPAYRTLQDVRASAFSPDGRRVAVATTDGEASIWNTETQGRLVLPRALSSYTSLAFSVDGTRLAAGSLGEAKLFDAATGREVLSFAQRGAKLAFTPDHNGLLFVHERGAFILRAPPLGESLYDWLADANTDNKRRAP